MAQDFDGIVLGLGGFGGAVFEHIARRGQSVVGIERFEIAHDYGSSHGETRIIRKAYFEHPDYVPLLLRSYELWRGLERDCGRALLHQVGLLIAGPPQGEAVAGARLARSLHGVPLDDLPPAVAATRFPGFRIPAGFDVVFEPDAGFLDVENCVRAQVERGVRAGGTVRTGERILSWESNGTTVRVVTDRDEYRARCAVIAAGPWTGELLVDLHLPLNVVRKPVLWCAVRSPAFDVANGAPTFYFEMAEGAFYGFPSLDGRTLKLAEHTGGQPVADPANVDRNLHPDDVAPVAGFIETCLPDLNPQPVRHSVCMYTLTPDHHFIVDRHPRFPNVAIAAGFSGHGFKFTQVLGEALADLAIEGATKLPIDFLGLGRLAIPIQSCSAASS